MPTLPLQIDIIRIDGGTQPREAIDEQLVAEYAESVGDLPPMVVFNDGADYWLADGFHRWHAYRKAGFTTVSCDVRKGTCRDAVLYSVGANAEHGKRRTNADKRKAVQTLLNDAEWSKWSDRAIAKACRVGADLVATVRPKIETVVSGSQQTRTYSHNKTGRPTEMIVAKKPTTRTPPPPEVEPLTPYEIAVENVAPLRELLDLVNDCLRRSAALAENKEVGHYFRHQQAIDGLTTAKAAVKFAMPKSACPYMPNCTRGKCKCCKGAGWIPADIYNNLSKDELAMLGGGK